MTTRKIEPNDGTTLASRSIAPGTSEQAKRLAAALQALAHGLPNPWDESTDFFQAFVVPLPVSTPLDAAAFHTALGVGDRYHIDLSPADESLDRLGRMEASLGQDVVAGFRQLTAVLRATLTGLSIAFARGAGVTRVRVWLFGRMTDGSIVGLRSISTET